MGMQCLMIWKQKHHYSFCMVLALFLFEGKDSFIKWFVTFAYKWQVNQTIEKLKTCINWE